MTILEIQKLLNKFGAKLVEDGKEGPKTTQAIKDFQKRNGLTADGIVGKYTLAKLRSTIPIGPSKDSHRSTFSYLKRGKLLTTNQITVKYGKPCDSTNFVTVDLPFPLRLSWETKTTVTRLQVHKAIKNNVVNALTEILNHYGQEKITELGIDLYGGCYNCRQMRSSKAWSVHSWALAIDLDPVRNGLNSSFLNSEFSKIEYKEMHEAFYRNGFINLGIEADMDAMHYQIAE